MEIEIGQNLLSLVNAGAPFLFILLVLYILSK